MKTCLSSFAILVRLCSVSPAGQQDLGTSPSAAKLSTGVQSSGSASHGSVAPADSATRVMIFK